MGTKLGPRVDGPWYGVKTLYRSSAVGRPSATDGAYDPTGTLVEERVVLFKARTFQEAMRLAETEARAYARGHHINPYGQRVITQYLGACDAYHLFSPPAAGVEVFSSSEIVCKAVSSKTIVTRRMGVLETEQQLKHRKKFLNREFSGTVRRGV